MTKYVGIEIEWELHLNQNGKVVTGSAKKTKIDGLDIPYFERTSTELIGTISGKEIIKVINHDVPSKKHPNWC